MNVQLIKALSLGLNIGVGMVGPIVVGVIADQYFGCEPVCLIIGLIVGLGCVITILLDLIKS